jgi:hypothetical protein
MHFPTPALSRFAWLIAGLTLVLMIAGALLTSNESGAQIAPTVFSLRRHVEIGLAVGAGALVLLLWLAPSNTPAWLRGLGWVAVVLFVIDAATAISQPVIPALSILHACLAPVFLATVVAIAVFVSPEWMLEVERVDWTPVPSIPLVAMVAPPFVLLQIALGAAYRHKMATVMPHMAGAMIVALLLLVLSVVLLQRLPKHPTLRPVAIATLTVVLTQVTLGIAAFVMRLLDFDTNAGFAFLAAGHIAVGALTLAASVVLALEIRRCRPHLE